MPDTQILLVFSFLALVVVLFFLEWLSIDIITLLLLIALVLSGILTPAEAFSGFATEIIMILGAVFVLSGALLETGVMDNLGNIIWRMAGGSRARIIVLVMLFTATISAFMNNTTTTAVFLPAVIAVCRRSQINPSQMLIPLAFASILGGTCSLIGTSTNVAASGVLERAGLGGFSLFEFSAVGIVATVVGILYMALFSHRLLPNVPEASFTEGYEMKQYLSEVVIPQASSLAGKRLRETQLSELGITVLEVVRKKQKIYAGPDTQLAEEDVLVVNATRESLLSIKETSGIEIKADVKLGDVDLITTTIKIVEAIVMPQSVLVGQTIKDINFRSRFGVTAMAIYRRGHSLADKLALLPLKVGDVLLLQGRIEQFDRLQGNPDLWVLEEMHHVPYRKRRGIYAVLAMGAAVALSGFGLMPISMAFLAAAVVVVIIKCITPEEAYDFIDWRMLILIGGMTSFGFAMEKTGAAEQAAAWIVHLLNPMGITVIMAGFALLTIALTQPMSNASAALVVLPIAITTAGQLGVNPRAFAIIVTLSASLSFITPLEPSCILVYGPGKYRFSHFIITGLPLTLLCLAIVLVLVPRIWPL